MIHGDRNAVAQPAQLDDRARDALADFPLFHSHEARLAGITRKQGNRRQVGAS